MWWPIKTKMFLWLGDGSVGDALVQPWKPEDGSLEVMGKIECGSPCLETQCDGSGSKWISGAYLASNLDCLAKYWPVRETVPQTKSGRCLKNGTEGVLSLCAHIHMQACIYTRMYPLNRDASWCSDSLQDSAVYYLLVLVVCFLCIFRIRKCNIHLWPPEFLKIAVVPCHLI